MPLQTAFLRSLPFPTPPQVRRLDQARVRLVKKADGERQVIYADVIEEAGLKQVACQRVCEDALRGVGVAYRTPRKKIQISEDDAAARKALAAQWLKRPATFWTERVHAFIDNKAWVMPLTPKQRKKYRQTLVTGHLRKKGEGALGAAKSI